MFRLVRRLPFFRLLALGQVALLARRHLQYLNAGDRRRLAELVRNGRNLSADERTELRVILGRLEAGQFARQAASALSPIGTPRRRFGRH